MALENEKYMRFTTFRRDGRAVSTPVWLVHLPGGEIGFSTGADSGKAKRLAHTSRVTVQACDMRGKETHGPVYEGTARVVSGTELDGIRAAIETKYGLMSRAIGLAETVTTKITRRRAPATRVGIVVSLEDGAGVG